MVLEEFYSSHLNRVSRSFAFCISQLQSPLREWVGLSYLLCRILDTVEDAPWTFWEEQQKQYQKFDRFLSSMPSSAEVREWVSGFPSSIPEGEQLLLKEGEIVFSQLHQNSSYVREVIQHLGWGMSTGMQHFSKKQRGEFRLKHLGEVNQYCFFVAGLVGEALARLLHYAQPRFEASEQNILKAHHFGLFLQKVNILKDQLKDEKEGRYLVPSRQEILESMQANAWGAFHFIEEIPLEERPFRLFCGWSLFLGLATLPQIEEAYAQGKGSKLTRSRTQQLILAIDALIEEPEKLRAFFVQKLGETGFKKEDLSLALTFKEDTSWFRKIYQGSLRPPELSQLGVV